MHNLFSLYNNYEINEGSLLAILIVWILILVNMIVIEIFVKFFDSNQCCEKLNFSRYHGPRGEPTGIKNGLLHVLRTYDQNLVEIDDGRLHVLWHLVKNNPYWMYVRNLPHSPGLTRFWQSFGTPDLHWCLPWLTFRNREYRSWLGTTAGHVSWTPTTRWKVSILNWKFRPPMTLTALFSKSILLPSTTNGKWSGSRGLAWIRNSSRQESRFLNVLGAVVSYTSTQQSAPR